MAKINYIGLDIETSGIDLDSSLLSIGVVDCDDLYDIEKMLYYEVLHKKLVCTPESFRVHKLDLKQMDTESPFRLELHDIDNLIFRHFCNYYGFNCRIAPAGFNVGTFDMAFVKKYLPTTAKMIGYRSCDLNSVLFTRIETDNKFSKKKKAFKKEATEIFTEKVLPTLQLKYHDVDMSAHNALFDAWVAAFIKNKLNSYDL